MSHGTDMDSFTPAPKLRPMLLDAAQPFIHRDLSWLEFNSRVLAEANLKENPLLERVKFLSITSSNLDEFFMIRMASLGRSISTALRRGEQKQLRRLRRIRSVILGKMNRFQQQQAQTLESLSRELSRFHLHFVTSLSETDSYYALAKQAFYETVFPELSAPEAVSAAQIGLIDNLQLAAVFPAGSFVRIPKKLKSVLTAQSSDSKNEPCVYFFFLDHLLQEFLPAAFGLKEEISILRFTRDADLSVDLEEEDTESVPDVVLSSLRKRDRGRPVRIQHRGVKVPHFEELLKKALRLSPQQIFQTPATLCLNGLWSVLNTIPESILKKRELLHAPIKGLVPREFRIDDKIFESLKKRDLLLHHPYDSFDAYVNWIRQACADSDVSMIQQTVYRVDALSPVIDALKSVAGRKKIRVVIELRARFDELNNLRLAEELRNAGIEVVFGFGKLKLHAKIALVSRKEEGGVRLYTHLSTGNYNSITARQYTDLAILTANPEIGEDALKFFDTVAKGEVPQTFKRLVPAPAKLHRRILQLIDAEITAAKAGKTARIVGKVNTLVDHAVIVKLYEASSAGVKVDLIVRGACALVPGAKKLSENIRVVSIVDRFLEHSRIYFFENSKALYLSSADWMPRNFFSRLELAFPVLDERLYRYISGVLLPAYMNDRVKAKELGFDGHWRALDQKQAGGSLRSQFFFAELAEQEYAGTPLEIK